MQGGTHYVFDYSEEQLRVTNPRAKKKGKATKEKGNKKRTKGDVDDAESKPKQKQQKKKTETENRFEALGLTNRCLNLI